MLCGCEVEVVVCGVCVVVLVGVVGVVCVVVLVVICLLLMIRACVGSSSIGSSCGLL